VPFAPGLSLNDCQGLFEVMENLDEVSHFSQLAYGQLRNSKEVLE
jgi:hypothetical protein